jgi:hypothetical protein
MKPWTFYSVYAHRIIWEDCDESKLHGAAVESGRRL